MRLNLLTGYTVLGSISVYARRALLDEWLAAVGLRLSRRSDSSSLDCTYKGSSPGQSVEPDTGQEWQPTTHRGHGDSAAIDEPHPPHPPLPHAAAAQPLLHPTHAHKLPQPEAAGKRPEDSSLSSNPRVHGRHTGTRRDGSPAAV